MGKKKTRKIVRRGKYPTSNMAIFGNIRQVDNPIIGSTTEPEIIEVSKDKNDKKKKK